MDTGWVYRQDVVRTHTHTHTHTQTHTHKHTFHFHSDDVVGESLAVFGRASVVASVRFRHFDDLQSLLVVLEQEASLREVAIVFTPRDLRCGTAMSFRYRGQRDKRSDKHVN